MQTTFVAIGALRVSSIFLYFQVKIFQVLKLCLHCSSLSTDCVDVFTMEETEHLCVIIYFRLGSSNDNVNVVTLDSG